jgi:hypothetical protein
MSLSSASPASVDRPDVTKSAAKPELSFKEVKDSLFKFLMQAGVPFSEAEKLPIKTTLVKKEKTDNFVWKFDSRGRRYSAREEIEHEFNLENHTFYKITCKLKDLTVNNLPVYVVTIPTKFEDMEQWKKNKIITIKKQHNIIIFDEYDWAKLNLDISDKNWLAPLTKGVLKSWARILFKKISQLGGEVSSKYNLNDLFSNIERNTKTTKNNQSSEQLYLDRIQQLRLKLIEQELKYSSNFSLQPTHKKILSSFTELDLSSLLWIEDTLDLVVDCISQVNLRQSKYKEHFRQANGKISPANSEVFASVVYDLLGKARRSLFIQNLGYGVLKIQNKTTFQ